MTWQRNKDLSAWIVKFELYRVFPTFSSFSLIQSLLSRVYVSLNFQKMNASLWIFITQKIRSYRFRYIIWVSRSSGKIFFFTVPVLLELLLQLEDRCSFPVSLARKLGNTPCICARRWSVVRRRCFIQRRREKMGHEYLSGWLLVAISSAAFRSNFIGRA